jgi:hypothetical protein
VQPVPATFSGSTVAAGARVVVFLVRVVVVVVVVVGSPAPA